MMVVSDRKRKPAEEQITRLLVLGDRRVGKSATIVRLTTGRFIQEYGDSTHRWLYRHKLYSKSNEEQSKATRIEIMEQIDLDMCNFANINLQESMVTNQEGCMPSILDNLRWADAYIVLYAINDINSYTKAVRYINLIENFIDSKKENSIKSPVKVGHYNMNKKKNSLNFNKSRSPSRAGSLHSNTKNIGSFSQLSNSDTQPQVRPILLIGNKKDLERTGGRQVTISEAESLALRHCAKFAEISIAESNLNVSKTIKNFIDTLRIAIEHEDDYQYSNYLDQNPIISLSQIHYQEPSTLPIRSVYTANCNTDHSVGHKKSSTESILAKIVKSKPVVCSIVQSTRIVGASQAITCKSNSIPSTCKPSKASKISRDKRAMSPVYEIAPAESKVDKLMSTSLSYHDKYEHLKSSFRKASMAIVSGKRMTENRSGRQYVSKSAQREDQLVNRSVSSTRTSIDSTELEAHLAGQVGEGVSKKPTVFVASSNWIRNHIKPNRGNSDSKLDCDSLLNEPRVNQCSFGDKLKKPLLRYASRRKTVAFEPVADGQISDENDYSEPIMKTYEVSCNKDAAPRYDYARCSSGRSSSSLSTSDTFGNVSSTTEFWHEEEEEEEEEEKEEDEELDAFLLTNSNSIANSFGERPRLSSDSRCDLSRTSMSATDSNELTDEDDQASPTLTSTMTNAETELQSIMSNLGHRNSQQPAKGIKQNQTCLSRSSNTITERSFCSPLLERGNISETGTGKFKTSLSELTDEVK